MDGKRTRRCRKGDETIILNNSIKCINKSGKRYKPNIWTNRGKYVNRRRKSRSKRSRISRKSKKSKKYIKRSRKHSKKSS